MLRCSAYTHTYRYQDIMYISCIGEGVELLKCRARLYVRYGVINTEWGDMMFGKHM